MNKYVQDSSKPLDQFANFSFHQNPLEQIAGPTPRVPDSVALKRGLGIFICRKVPGDADAEGDSAAPGTTLSESHPTWGSEAVEHLGKISR